MNTTFKTSKTKLYLSACLTFSQSWVPTGIKCNVTFVASACFFKVKNSHFYVILTKKFHCHQLRNSQTSMAAEHHRFICQKTVLPVFGTWQVVILDLDGRKWKLNYTIMSLWPIARLLCVCESGIIMKVSSVSTLSGPHLGNQGWWYTRNHSSLTLGIGAAATVGARDVFLSIWTL